MENSNTSLVRKVAGGWGYKSGGICEASNQFGRHQPHGKEKSPETGPIGADNLDFGSPPKKTTWKSISEREEETMDVGWKVEDNPYGLEQRWSKPPGRWTEKCKKAENRHYTAVFQVGFILHEFTIPISSSSSCFFCIYPTAAMRVLLMLQPCGLLVRICHCAGQLVTKALPSSTNTDRHALGFQRNTRTRR